MWEARRPCATSSLKSIPRRMTQLSHEGRWPRPRVARVARLLPAGQTPRRGPRLTAGPRPDTWRAAIRPPIVPVAVPAAILAGCGADHSAQRAPTALRFFWTQSGAPVDFAPQKVNRATWSARNPSSETAGRVGTLAPRQGRTAGFGDLPRRVVEKGQDRSSAAKILGELSASTGRAVHRTLAWTASRRTRSGPLSRALAGVGGLLDQHLSDTKSLSRSRRRSDSLGSSRRRHLPSDSHGTRWWIRSPLGSSSLALFGMARRSLRLTLRPSCRGHGDRSRASTTRSQSPVVVTRSLGVSRTRTSAGVSMRCRETVSHLRCSSYTSSVGQTLGSAVATFLTTHTSGSRSSTDVWVVRKVATAEPSVGPNSTVRRRRCETVSRQRVPAARRGARATLAVVGTDAEASRHDDRGLGSRRRRRDRSPWPDAIGRSVSRRLRRAMPNGASDDDQAATDPRERVP